MERGEISGKRNEKSDGKERGKGGGIREEESIALLSVVNQSS